MSTLFPPHEVESFPLPAGMRDLLPLEAHARRFLARSMLEHVELHGYSPVLLPAFELASVLERGLGTLDPGDVIRFVEPGSGEIAALRPDMTPQVARMVASRMRELPTPIRLAYEGTVLRRRQERARRHRQIPQAGVELLGVQGPEGDLEILRLAMSSLVALGIDRFVIDIGHARVVRGLLDAVPAEWHPALLAALSVKDEVRTAEILRALPSTPPNVAKAIVRLPALHGPVSVLEEGLAVLRDTPAEEAVVALTTLVDALRSRGLADRVQIDLGEVRGFAYYTGLLFHVLADGPGTPLGGGGRYDELLSRFGVPMPAVGFALDLDHVAWARRSAGLREPKPRRVLVDADASESERVANALRSRGISAVIWPGGNAQSRDQWASSWAISAIVRGEPSGEWTLFSPSDQQVGLDSGRGLWQPTGRTQTPAVRHVGEDEHPIAAWVDSLLEEKSCPPS